VYLRATTLGSPPSPGRGPGGGGGGADEHGGWGADAAAPAASKVVRAYRAEERDAVAMKAVRRLSLATEKKLDHLHWPLVLCTIVICSLGVWNLARRRRTRSTRCGSRMKWC